MERLKQSGRQFLLNLKFCQEIATKATQHFIPHTEQMYTMCPAVHPLSIAKAKVLDEHGRELCLNLSTSGSNDRVHSQLDLESALM